MLLCIREGANRKTREEKCKLLSGTMTLTVLRTPTEMRRTCDQVRRRGETVGLVPTMGALHEGHLALVREAKCRADFVLVTVFVNPTQFGPSEDLARYPRDLDGDAAKVASVGASAVFFPEAAAMYPAGDETRVRVGALAVPLCGQFRPGHFEGVATIVAKLFVLAGPSVALFGRKDYQQLAIVRRMAIDLFLPVDVVGHPIVREPDGLAMSSRNAYLSIEERARARGLSKSLATAARLFEGGEREATVLRGAARAALERVATSIDYVEVADPIRLTPFGQGRVGDVALLAVACRIGTTRLIDNMVLGEEAAPAGAAKE
jgi:pantoate--beta-alanine ligase